MTMCASMSEIVTVAGREPCDGDHAVDGVETLTGSGAWTRDFRAKYLGRLSNEKVWVPQPQRPPKHQTVIIFDWDDTLLCTSWLSGLGNRRPDRTVDAQLKAIERHALKMLTTAMDLGETLIITNAMTGWVEQSASRWAPSLLPLLRKVQIISARDVYQRAYPYEADRWKVEAFLEVQRRLPDVQVTNLIALGDSEFEMTAARKMREQFDHALLKTVKFQASPCPRIMLKQMELVSHNLCKIVNTTKNMRVLVDKKA